ncbi:peroxisome assembly factor 2 isoform X2 [Orussus abietinus]|uniref:peroxisome assembly factor 2 isoform X2 n=1 Tax=Orussus abietinus TaxID=222816 RepID=UPI000625FB0D|nr:peroxisome assembly factor 2 isoform X2 [Orussus abietinus]
MRNDIDRIILIQALAKSFMRHNPAYALALVFIHYVLSKLNALLNMKLKMKPVPRNVLKYLVNECCNDTTYIDYNTCIIANPIILGTLTTNWFNVCSIFSRKKYKLIILPHSCTKNDELLVSETVLFNVRNTLQTVGRDDATYFIMPSYNISVKFATEAMVSLVRNPFDCSDELIDAALQSYFSQPRYLRVDDLFSIDIKEYAPEYFYYTPSSSLHGENVHSYIPGKYTIEIPEEICSLSIQLGEGQYLNNCPPSLKTSLEKLEACILPFMQKYNKINIKPVFLVQGPPGCGKFKLAEIVAERSGFHLLCVDFAEVHSLTAAQTEAKLRIALHNAKSCVPCILKLSNIQIFGKDSEGRKDERTLSAYLNELNKLFEKPLKYPLIIMATSDMPGISSELLQTFIETIELSHLDKSERCDLLEWMLQSKGLCHETNLSKLAGLYSDFVYADFETLIQQAVKIRYQEMTPREKISLIKLQDNDFSAAYEQMQSISSDRIGAPRIPKVHWDDVGGLADIKHEIRRRIELPLLSDTNLGRSGLLLYGPPGTGKTLLAKAIATECQLQFLSVKGPELLNMYVGQSEKNVRQVFERARAAAPCIIFFDELDSLAPNRGRSGDSGGVMDRVVSQLLAEMDGLDSSNSTFIIGATNRPDLIDPALLRPGRFDKMLYVGVYSSRDAQLGVLTSLTRRFAIKNREAILLEVVEQLPGNLTGADLYAVCSNAWLLAVRRNLANVSASNDSRSLEIELTVELQDFLQAIRDLVPSVSKEEILRYEKLRSELSS